MANFTGGSENIFNRTVICNTTLEPHTDFKWTINRTSYALEWGLICSNETKGSNLKSFFFIGAFLGLIVGTALFDRIGRKITCLIGIAITVISSIAGTFVTSYSAMLPLRIAHGFGAFIGVTGVDLLSIEFTPTILRNLAQLLSSSTWDLGSFVIVGISYGLTKWNHIYLAEGCLLALTAIPVLIYPESPRFQLVKGKEKEARATFKKLSKIFKTEETPDHVEMTYQDYDKNYFGQVKDLKDYPLMLKNTAILMSSWFFIATISYGLLFSWGKLGADIYSSIMFGTLGGFIAKGTGMVYFMIHFFGRKKAVMVNFAGIAVIFFLAIPSYGVRISGTWTLDNIVCLLASPFISGTWASVGLLTKELSPTSHRGMIYCMGSASARVGAFIGPYLALLYNTMDTRIVLAIFGGMGALACLIAYFNCDSTDKPIPSTPEELLELHSPNEHAKLKNKVEDEA